MCMMIDDKSEFKKQSLQERAKLSGCEFTDGQILFVLAELEKERVFNAYLSDRGLEFANERTRESVARDFDDLIYAEGNKDDKNVSEVSFEEILDSLVKDETGEFIWDLFTPESGKKNFLSVEGENTAGIDRSKLLPPCGSIEVSEGTNPFDKNSWNMVMQSKIYKENPEIAKYLASLAKK